MASSLVSCGIAGRTTALVGVAKTLEITVVGGAPSAPAFRQGEIRVCIALRESQIARALTCAEGGLYDGNVYAAVIDDVVVIVIVANSSCVIVAEVRSKILNTIVALAMKPGGAGFRTAATESHKDEECELSS